MWTASRMRSALLATAALVIAVASATSLATSSSDVSWCANTADVVLTSCGSLCGEDQACAQYPQKATTKCSEAARNKCVVYDDSCTYQCLNVYNDQVGKWTLFVKDPKTSDKFAASDNGFPVAPVSQFVDYTFASDAKTIQITGYDSIDVSKGSVQKVKLDTDIFTKSATVTQLALQNLDLSKIASNFLPTSLVTLLLDNCLLKDIPSDVGNMQNIKTFNVSNNDISDLPSADSKIVKMFQGLTTLNLRGNALTSFQWKLPSLTTLDLGNNKLTEFPTSIFNMTTLTTVYLDGNAIPSLSLTSAQLTYLKRMNAGSTLGIKAASGSCASGQTEEKLLDSVVCVTTSSPETTKAASSSGSSNTVIIIVAVVGGLLVVGAIGFVWHRRSKKQSEFYVSVMENGGGAYTNNTGGTTGGNNTNQSRTSMFGRNRAQSGGTRGSVQDNRNSRGNSMASRPSNMTRPSKTGTNTGYAELSKPQEDFDRGSTATSGGATIFSGTRQRQSAKINQNVVRIASNDITYTRTIAKGAFGEVWLAHLGRDLVAVKKLLSTDPTSVGDFIAELNLLSSLSHPRILGLLGACWDDELTDLQIVTEFMDSGDLLTVLRRSSPTELTWEKTKGAYCLQVCEAVYYLHSLQPALIHRDIKSRNILVDERKGAKLSDFGESRERTIQNTMTAGVGTARWVAPEIILGENYSELADIYSLGVLLTELDTHQIPFETLGLEEHMIVTQVAVGKLRPKVSDSCPEVIRRLAHECLQFDPQLRPTAARVLQTLMSSPLIGRPSTIKE